MADAARRSTFTDRLEDALAGNALPYVALAVGLAAAGLWYLGFLSERNAAALLVIAVAALVAAMMLRSALSPLRRGGAALPFVAAALTLVGTAWPALRTLAPGDPVLSGELSAPGESIPLAQGMAGPVRLLVNARLREAGEPTVDFTLGGTSEPVHGRLERTYGYARVGRRGRARVAHEHNAEWFSASIPGGATALRLERLSGQLAGPLHVSVYRALLPFPWGPLALALVALVVAAVADARGGLRGNEAVWSAMGLAFGLLVAFNATPSAAVGPAMGGIVLGAILGALSGWIAGLVARKLVPGPEPRKRTAASA